ncbi:MAG: hypothetical protein LUH21_13765 [Clostridiales bacterium]|nr:hypothetical protein [Clostridiales bacterium]
MGTPKVLILWRKISERFGFRSVNIDGHDFEAIKQAYSTEHFEQPLAIIASIVKGKYINFAGYKAEGYQKYLPIEFYEQALLDLKRIKNDGI